jgi:hypothetical protein
MPIVPKVPGTVPHYVINPNAQPRGLARRRVVVRPSAVDAPPPSSPAYEVGYAKPPKHTRFKPGQSGNLKGRPKGAKSLKTIVRKLLTSKVTVRTASGPQRMSKVEALMHKQIEKAFAGDLRAIASLLHFYQTFVPEDAGPSSSTPTIAELDAHDQAILEALRREILSEGEEDVS